MLEDRLEASEAEVKRLTIELDAAMETIDDADRDRVEHRQERERLEVNNANLRQMAKIRRGEQLRLIDALRDLEELSIRGAGVGHQLDPALILDRVHAALVGNHAPLKSLSREIQDLRAENLNLRQELHEPDSPAGKAYQSVVTGLAADVEAARGERDRAFDTIEDMCANSWEFGRQLADKGGKLERAKDRAQAVLDFLEEVEWSSEGLYCPGCGGWKPSLAGPGIEVGHEDGCGFVGAMRRLTSIIDDSAVPPGEVWLKNDKGEVLCKIINVGTGDAPEEGSG